MANILIMGEYSGRVRDAFIKAGHRAVSCDFLPTDVSGPHYQGDVFNLIYQEPLEKITLTSGEVISHGTVWDAMIAFPPCTYLCSSGLHWNKRRPERAAQTEEAIDFVKKLWNSPIPIIVIENPIGCLSTRFQKPTQIVQPWMFGEDASKATCLFIKGLPALKPTNIIKKSRYANQTASGQNNLAPSPDRWKIRSITYQGIANAMADQWSSFI